MNKLFFNFLFVCISALTFAQDEADNLPLYGKAIHIDEVKEKESFLKWEDNFKKALKKSKKQNKPVLLYFTGSDWCGPCKVLDKKLFHSDKFKAIADKDLILHEINNPQNKDLVTPKRMKENYDLIRKYKVKSYPTLVFVNHKGAMIGYKKGLILTEYYYPFINSVIENY
ncbi:thioredoxin family protein [uncultured Polaribacter sp.]|uniref:thioredoxin family protein n=1 Tax=uncultured Polaribacter sp. TaxID=174711 RepID=UPI00262432A9|nr:thioredoxin family protein [uncultured Polaribacter sp.]